LSLGKIKLYDPSAFRRQFGKKTIKFGMAMAAAIPISPMVTINSKSVKPGFLFEDSMGSPGGDPVKIGAYLFRAKYRKRIWAFYAISKWVNQAIFK
jgi:hypothetical protein